MDEKIARLEAERRAKPGEEVHLLSCPCCNELLAVYIAQDKAVAAKLPNPAKPINEP